jgi:sensor domain CHASE-containing protein
MTQVAGPTANPVPAAPKTPPKKIFLLFFLTLSVPQPISEKVSQLFEFRGLMNRGATGISRRTGIISVLLSVFIVVMVAAGTVLSAIGEVSRHANQLDDDRSRQTTAGALKTFLTQLGATLNDYAAWDDAATNAYAEDGMPWMKSNFGEMSANSALFDIAVVLDDEGKTIMAYQDGAEMTVPVDTFFDSSLKRLFSEASAASSGLARASRRRGVHSSG